MARTRRIDDLPDELLQLCFARLCLRSIARLKTVCQRWNRTLSDPSLMFRLRSSLGFTRPWAFSVHSNYNDVGSFDGIQISAVEVPPLVNGSDRSPVVQMTPPLPHRVAVLRGPPRLQYGAVAGADGRRLYILGGRTPLMSVSPDEWLVFNRVDAYDPVARSWCETAPMLAPRYAFAVATAAMQATDGTTIRSVPSTTMTALIVAGGYDSYGMPLRSAEMYDARSDRWQHIPAMRRISGACKGLLAHGRFYVFMANNGPDAFEAFDLGTRRWVSVTDLGHHHSNSNDGIPDGDVPHIVAHPSPNTAISCSSPSFTTNPCAIIFNL